MRDGFIIHEKTMNQIGRLNDEQAGELLKAMIAHYKGEDCGEMSQVVDVIMVDAAERMDVDAQNYEDIAEKRAEAGRKGAEKRWQIDSKVMAKDGKRMANDSKAMASDGESVSVSDIEKLSSNEDSKKKPAPKEKPMHFGDLGNVLLTETEHAKLIADKGQKAVDDAIAYLDAYIADKGYKHKSPTHYLAMRRWVFDAVNERKSPPGKIRPINKGYSERTYDMDAVEKDLFAKMMAEG